MKYYFKYFIILFYCIFIISMIAQSQEISKETELETDIKNLISMKGKFDKLKTERIVSDTYYNMDEYDVNVKPLNWSYKLSVLQQNEDKTAAFIYANYTTSETAFFYLNLYVFLSDETKGWKQIYEQGGEKNISRIKIIYKNKAVGFMRLDDRNNQQKILLFIGNLSKEDMDVYVASHNGEAKTDTDNLSDFTRDFNSLNRVSSSKKLIDTAEKNKNDRESLLAFMSQFDSTDMSNWKLNTEANKKVEKDTFNLAKFIEDFENTNTKEQADKNKVNNEKYEIQNIQTEMISLINHRDDGFFDLKNGIQSQTSGGVFYYAKRNSSMIASVEYIVEKNNKNSYCAFYNNDREKKISSNAFLTLPYYNTSAIKYRVEIGKSTNLNEIIYNLYADEKFVAIYASTKNDASIQIFQMGFH